MLKEVVKRILGRRLATVFSAGIRTLADYPQYLHAGIAGPLRSLDIEVTFRCNARCRMCPLYGKHSGASPRDRLSTGARN